MTDWWWFQILVGADLLEEVVWREGEGRGGNSFLLPSKHPHILPPDFYPASLMHSIIASLQVTSSVIKDLHEVKMSRQFMLFLLLNVRSIFAVHQWELSLVFNSVFVISILLHFTLYYYCMYIVINTVSELSCRSWKLIWMHKKILNKNPCGRDGKGKVELTKWHKKAEAQIDQRRPDQQYTGGNYSPILTVRIK